MLFDENYGLAATQSLKNKDIPEGGAKGTILPSSVFPHITCLLLFIFDLVLGHRQDAASRSTSM